MELSVVVLIVLIIVAAFGIAILPIGRRQGDKLPEPARQMTIRVGCNRRQRVG